VVRGRRRRRGEPGRDKRLTRDLLDAIASATEDGQSVNSSKLKLRFWWAPEQVWQELRLLWDLGLIRAESRKTLSDPDSMTALLIFGLTADGWELYNELRRSPWLNWLTNRWRWLIGTVITAVGVAAAVAALWK
jgi:hypothetical protein